MKKRVETKVRDFDIKDAIKVITSDDSLALFDENILKLLQDKHPRSTHKQQFIEKFEEKPLVVLEAVVRKAVNSFPYASAAGIHRWL